MQIIRDRDPDFALRLAEACAASSLFDPEIERRTREILDAVRDRGDAALLEFTERFDGARLRADQLAVTDAERMTAALQADPALRNAVREVLRNVTAFARRSKRRNWQMRNSHGAVVGEKFDPFQRVGIYIPGGRAPLISTALMTIPLAKVAGCPEIVVCTPCNREGVIDPALLYAATVAGATEIYRVGGAQAIAAMAYGTATLRPVQKIFGPGNAYVVMAKRLLVGQVAIDLLPGPSEVLVVADDSADPRLAAADMLAQAEHGSGEERVWLVTTSGRVLRAVERELRKQVKALERREWIEKVLEKNTWLIQVRDLESAVAVANRLAPEHCEVHTRQPARVAEGIRTAGALFLGPWSPTVLGDYVAGPSHTLPTGGAGLSFAGLTVDQFQRRTSMVTYDRTALRKALPTVQEMARREGLSAHARSAELRLE
ncbi:histidinol dehydrogenase [Limisphaera ngatamarikiensis]|uniref:Histidinol dehydrogenase n=1 Tax=Limisphaera ngatamarikiensis TaxID=1324935 RepID=A0A6M1S104_9BACT|nr:histidinol dehydrogenase [Limisphaera ngatamarikiensis]NGO40582.1 histidinol dehydrogenase [Limisphaera ngatamarikiensis]